MSSDESKYLKMTLNVKQYMTFGFGIVYEMKS